MRRQDAGETAALQITIRSFEGFQHRIHTGVENNRGDPLKVSLTERTLKVGQNKSSTVQLQYRELEFDWKKIFPDIFEEIPSLESALRQALRPYFSLIRGVIMVVTVSKGFRHNSIPTAEKILGELGKKSGAFEVDYVRNDEEFAKALAEPAPTCWYAVRKTG